MDFPLRFTVYDGYTRKGSFEAPLWARATIRHNLPSTCTVALPDDSIRADRLITPGARLVVEYMDLGTPKKLMSGLVVPAGERSEGSGVLEVEVQDDKNVFWTLLGWPNPSGTIVQQGDEDAYYTSTGTAEAVVKALVTANMGHVATPLTVASSLGRGSNVSVSVRMHPLADRMFPAVDLAGIGVSVLQVGSGQTVDVYVPTDRTTRVLTEESGVVTSGRWSLRPPTVTRVVVAGPGEGLAREFASVNDTAAETEWGVSIEQMRDARDLDPESVTLQADLEARGQQLLDEGKAQPQLSATLSETEHFRYGVAYDIGDLVAVKLGNSPVLTERVRSIEFDLSPDNGLTITPKIGNDGSSESVTARHLAALAASVRNLNAST